MRLHDFAFCACSAFLVGVFLVSIAIPPGFIFLVGFIGGIFLWRYLGIGGASLVLVTFVLGCWYFSFWGAWHKNYVPLDEFHEFSGLVREEPLSGMRSQQLSVDLLSPYRGEVRIYAEAYPEFSYGDLLSFSGVIQKSPSGAIYIVSFPKIKLVKSGEGSQFKQSLFWVKERFTSSFASFLPREESALLEGLLTGGTANFSADFKIAIQKSGMSHIVALSGYNISVVGMALSFLLAFFLTPRKAFYFAVLAIILFVLMTGASASSVRAAIMGIILLLAKRTGRLYNMRNSIVITAAIMALFNPSILAHDIGFQLSFGALLGIVYVMPVLEELLKFQSGGFLNWRTNALTALSAQIVVLPLLLYYFQQFNIFSIISNILILEAVPIAMLFGFFLGVAGLLLAPLAALIALPTSALLKYQIFTINLFSHAPIFSYDISGWMIFLYYGFVIWLLVAISYKKPAAPESRETIV
jgi:competence protein ComEC